MNFDFGEVLSRAWQITWKQRILWIIGIVFGLVISLLFALMFAVLFLPLLGLRTEGDVAPVFLWGTVLSFILFILIAYPASVLTQTSLTLGILDAEQARPNSVSDLLKRSLPFFWRVLGLMVLFAVCLTLINLLIQAVFFFFTIATHGIGSFCILPLMLLYYPLLYASIVWMELAMNAIIVDDMRVFEAVGQGWRLIRKNLLAVVLTAVIVYVGVGMLTGMVLVPVLLPLFLVPLALSDHQTNWTIIWIAALGLLAFIPLFAILTGLSMLFTKAAWVLTYLRLGPRPQTPPLPEQATE